MGATYWNHPKVMGILLTRSAPDAPAKEGEPDELTGELRNSCGEAKPEGQTECGERGQGGRTAGANVSRRGNGRRRDDALGFDHDVRVDHRACLILVWCRRPDAWRGGRAIRARRALAHLSPWSSRGVRRRVAHVRTYYLETESLTRFRAGVGPRNAPRDGAAVRPRRRSRAPSELIRERGPFDQRNMAAPTSAERADVSGKNVSGPAYATSTVRKVIVDLRKANQSNAREGWQRRETIGPASTFEHIRSGNATGGFAVSRIWK